MITSVDSVDATYSAKPRILVPYKNQWEVASHLPEYRKLSEKVEFYKYEMSTKNEFIGFLKSDRINAFWLTEEFFSVLGNPSDYIDFFPSSLKAILVPWVGCDFINSKLLRSKGITLCNIGPHAADHVTELVIFLAIACFRMTSFWEYCFKFVENGNAEQCKKYISSDSYEVITDRYHGQEMKFPQRTDHAGYKNYGEVVDLANQYTVGGKIMDSPMNKTVLILGFGSIGQNIGANLQKIFNMSIEYSKRSGPVQKDILGYNAKYHSDLNDPSTWQNADLIILALPGAQSTNDIINRESLARCKDGVRIVNVGRGTCIDEDALLDALESGKVASCGLDVFKNEETGVKQELLRRWDVTALPHIGSTVADMIIKQTLITLENAHDIFVNGGHGKYVLN
ncbi:YPL113C [Saccharomyces arboricola H-6]|uniref:YPL113C n=1 Tax=Saccharomyces arboricola (strain H-6 / AS 2.3317 / CBS 10644) TaxID=1160507 RepID=J8PVN2_SACAR|nr:YPL113C [Saccharomyces arboricola H-6]